MVDVPCLDHLWDSQKDCPGDMQIIGSMIEIPGNMPLCMLLGPLWQSCHSWITYRSIFSVVIVTTDHITCGMTSHVQPGCAQWMDTHDYHMSD